ncbi:MAG: choice-of-anchor Q domain-containing protein [Bacteroidales bacterium]
MEKSGLMSRGSNLIFSVLLILLWNTGWSQNKSYVTPAGAGLMNGTSWENAYPGTRVQTAINKPGITEVWVKKGTYTTDSTSTGNVSSFWKMKNGVTIYGGFSGTESSTDDRTDYRHGGSNETVLSAVLSSMWTWNIFNNEYSATFSSLNSSAILDGFTFFYSMYGAISNSGDPASIFSPTIRNCTFVTNWDGAIKNYYSSPTISNCTFTENNRGVPYSIDNKGGGGAIYNLRSSPSIQSCVFTSNTAYGYGGAIFDSVNSSPDIICCTFTSNHAYTRVGFQGQLYQEGLGGAIYNDASSPSSIISCLFYSNTSDAGGGAFFNKATYPMIQVSPPPAEYISNCTFYNNQTSANGGAIYNSGSVFAMANSVIRGNISSAGFGNNFFVDDAFFVLATSCYSNGTNDVAGSGNFTFYPDYSATTDDPMFVNSATGDLRLYSGSPCVNTGYAFPYLPPLDVRGKPRVQNNYVDMGANEWTGGTDPMTQSSWTGALGNNWNTPGNWSTGFVPKYWRLCDVTIPDVTIDPVVDQDIADTALVRNLNIESGAVLTIAPGSAFTVTGSLTNSAGTDGLKIVSDATGTGSLIQHTLGVSATVERYMNNADWTDSRDGWHFLSSPVVSQAISPAFTMSPVATGPYDFYCWHEPLNVWVNYKHQSTGGGAAPFFDAVNGSANFSVGRGYMAAYDAEGVKSYAGTLNAENVTVSGLTISGSTQTNRSWHLLGNPFASALSWDVDDAWNRVNISGVAKVWNESIQDYSDITSEPPSIIPVANGFMVQVSSGTGSLTIPVSRQVHSAQPYYKSALPVIRLIARNLSSGNAKESSVWFNPDATTGFDLLYDGAFLAGHGPLFYSVAGVEHLSTNSLPEVDGTLQVPFDFIKNDGTAFTIEAKMISGIDGAVILNDLKTGASQDLTGNPLYAFTAASGDNPSRFVVTFAHTGFNETNSQNTISIYTAGNTIRINNRTGKGRGEVFVYNLMGQHIASASLNGNPTCELNLNVPAGCYLVKVVTPEVMEMRKIVLR